MENGNKKYWSGLLSGLLLALCIFGFGFVGKQVYTIYTLKHPAAAEVPPEKLLDTYTSSKVGVIEDTIETYYLEEVEKRKLQDGIYSGMVEALGDPYSAYYSAEELKDIRMKTEGIYYGIGAYVSKAATDDFCTLSGIIGGTPAEEAGLRAGDIIYKVDDTPVQGMETTAVVALIKGEEGTTVHLTLVRDGESDFLEVDVERRQIESPTVEYSMKDNNIGYLQITEFDDVTVDQFAEALAVLKGSGMKGLILDLRSNPGGSLTVVCEIARMLLPKGLIVYTEDKYGQREEYTCDGKRQLTVPMVVLVNGYSASASEILAGAIKDYGIGTIMGTTTFGKGIVQRIISLSDGSAVKLTVSKYYTPNGNNIHEIGIEPDVVVEFDPERYYGEGADNQLEEALKFLDEKIEK